MLSNIASYTANGSVKSMQSRVLQLLMNHSMISSEFVAAKERKKKKFFNL